MGCLKLTYEETPALFLGERPEKSDTIKWQVWVNPDSDFLGVGNRQTQGSEPPSFGFGPGSDLWNSSSNYMTGIGMAVDGAAFSLGRALDKRLAYSARNPSWGQWASKSLPVGPTRIGGFNVPTGLAKGAANTLKVGGAVLGVIGVGMTGYEIYTGQKSLIGEGGLDLFMGGVAFIPGGGWIASGLYFGGKWALEASGNDFWNKP